MRDLASLPKAELHLHLEGAMRPGTLRELCQKYSIPIPTIRCWDSQSNKPIPSSNIEPFTDFSEFVDVYVAACSCLRTEEDVHRLVLEVAQDLKKCHVVYAEVAPSFTFYSQYFGSMERTLNVLVDAASIAERETGVLLGFVISVERQLGVEEAMKLAHLANKASKTMKINERDAIVGFGLHGPEEGHPPESFKEAFELACGDDSTLVSLPHAGEIAPSPGTGAKSVCDAVHLLNAKRIAHGILAKDDTKTLQLLKEKDIVLDIGITSNYLLNVVKSREDHPIKHFLNQGIKCTINSDDPLLFGCNILSEYQMCRDVLGMDDETIAQCTKTAFQYSCAPEGLKSTWIRDVDEWISE